MRIQLRNVAITYITLLAVRITYAAASNSSVTTPPDYFLRKCIADAEPCNKENVTILQFSSSQLDKQREYCKSLRHTLTYVLTLVFIALIIWSVYTMAINYSYMHLELPQNNKLTEYILQEAKNGSWHGVSLKESPDVSAINKYIDNKKYIMGDNVVTIKKSTLLDNMYRNTSLIGAWISIIVSDYCAIQYTAELLPPQLPSAQIIAEVHRIRWYKVAVTTIMACILYNNVWKKIILLTIPTLLGLTDEEDDSGAKLIGIGEKWKANNKRAESWMEKTFDTILGLSMLSLVRCFLSATAWNLNYRSITDYNFAAALVTLPFIVDFPIYIVVFITGATTCGLAEAQWRAVYQYAEDLKECMDSGRTCDKEKKLGEKIKSMKRMFTSENFKDLATAAEEEKLRELKKQTTKVIRVLECNNEWKNKYLSINGPLRSMFWLHGFRRFPYEMCNTYNIGTASKIKKFLLVYAYIIAISIIIVKNFLLESWAKLKNSLQSRDNADGLNIV